MSLTISTVRDELKTLLSNIAGLRSHDTFPDKINPPAAIVVPDEMDFDRAMGRGLDECSFKVFLLVSRATDRVAQDKLDAYLASSGASSVKAAIEATRPQTLNGAAHDAVVRGWKYQQLEVAGTAYLGAEFTVDVTG